MDATAKNTAPASKRLTTAPSLPKIQFRPALLDSLKTYSVSGFRTDALAGIDVAFVALPLSIALAIAAGATPIAGLYTAIVGGAVAALLGGSRVQISGPTAAFVIILSPLVAQHGMFGLCFASILAGIILILMGLSGMGALIKYIPHPVTTGYNTGIAILIGVLQIRDLFGLQVSFDHVTEEYKNVTVNGQMGVFHATQHHAMQGLPDHFYDKLFVLYSGFCATPWSTLGHTVGAAGVTLAVLVFYPRVLPLWAKRVPAPLLAIVAGIAFTLLAARFLGWQDVETVHSRFGDFSRSLPGFNLEFFQGFDWRYSNLSSFVMPATSMAMLCAIASLLSAVVADSMTGTRHDSNSELIAQGVGNIVSPLFGGIAISGAVARTCTSVRNGARTPVAALVHSATLLLMLLLAAPYLSYIPMASLAAILVLVAYNMANIPHFRHMLSAPRSDVLVLLTCLGLTVFVDMAVAIMVGMMLAALLFIRRMAELTSVDLLGSASSDAELHSHDLADTDIPRGVSIYNVDGPFCFGATEKAIAAMEEIGGRTKVVILRLNRVPAMDATGLYALEKIFEHLQAKKLTLIISGLRQQPRGVMEKAGFLKKIGAENVVPDIEWAVVRCYELLGPGARGTEKMAVGAGV